MDTHERWEAVEVRAHGSSPVQPGQLVEQRVNYRETAMHLRAIASGLALAFLVGFSASAATVSGASGAGTTASAVDMGLLNSLMSGRPLVVAQAVCVKGGEPCDDQHPCCKGLTCTKNLLDKAPVCHFGGCPPTPPSRRKRSSRCRPGKRPAASKLRSETRCGEKPDERCRLAARPPVPPGEPAV